MKKKNKVLAILIVLMMVFSLCACGGKSTDQPAKEPEVQEPAAEETVEEETVEEETETEAVTVEEAEAPEESGDAAETAQDLILEEPVKQFPVEGEYSVFAVKYQGYTVRAEDLEVNADIVLAEDGTGSFTYGEETVEITSWTKENDVVTITLSDESSANAASINGILELDIYGTGDMILYFAQEGADTSAYQTLTLEAVKAALAGEQPDSKLFAAFNGMDTEAGVHMNYDVHYDYMDADQSLDVHGKSGVFYSHRTTKVSGYESSMVTYCADGKAYNLYPDKMQGIIATESIPGIVQDNVMVMDNLYSLIWRHAKETEYTTETREVDGVTYTVEVFPATEYTAEAAFYFDDAGNLVHALEGAPVVEAAVEIGETFYTIKAIDDAVDESLFDISGYEIGEL